MEKEFVSYEQAVALKELGFTEKCLGYYNADPQLKKPFFNLVQPFDHEWCIPTFLKQQVFRWFREKYGWYANVSSWLHDDKKGLYHDFEIYGTPNTAHGSPDYDTYEEVENAAIDKLIQIAKQQNNGKV